MNKSFTNLNSSAINSVTIEENVVKVVYNSNIGKEYSFDCANVEQFQEDLSKELIGIEMNDTTVSVGRFINQQIKTGVLVQSK